MIRYLVREMFMDNFLFEKENIVFMDNIHRIFEKLPEDALFVVDKKLFQISSELKDLLKAERVYLYEASEENKTLLAVERIYDFLLKHHTTETLIGIGGGITGDVAGFAAATFKRGIPFILVPTTLLSMCDSAAGGKCGVNYQGIKNYIGTFRKPDEILICTDFLNTLEKEELKSGLGEIIKYGLLEETGMILGELNSDKKEISDLPLESIIKRGLMIKMKAVEEDFRDTGIRNMLNLGHNVGHAVESVLAGQITHGEAVALGLLTELSLSERKLGLDPLVKSKVIEIMKKYEMKDTLRGISREKLMDALKKDKKNDKHMRFTLLQKTGEPVIKVQVEEEEILQALTIILE